MTINLIALRRAVKNGNPTFSGKAMSELLDAYDAKAALVVELEQALEQAREVIAPFAKRYEEFVFVIGGAASIEFADLRRAAEWMKSVMPSAGEGR